MSPPTRDDISSLMICAQAQGRDNNPLLPATCHSHKNSPINKWQQSNQILMDKIKSCQSFFSFKKPFHSWEFGLRLHLYLALTTFNRITWYQLIPAVSNASLSHLSRPLPSKALYQLLGTVLKKISVVQLQPSSMITSFFPPSVS